MKTPIFKYKNGHLTPYAFACGYIEEKNGWKLWKDGCWHVRRSFEEWESYDTLKEAREAFSIHTSLKAYTLPDDRETAKACGISVNQLRLDRQAEDKP